MTIPRPRYFAIFAGMRTGSNLLERLLARLPDLSLEGELFNPGFIGKVDRRVRGDWTLSRRDADPVGLLEQVIADTGDAVPGFRIFDGHDPAMLDHAARDPACAKIVLTRDPAESYVSLKIARETDQWRLSDPARRRTARIRFDPDEYDRFAGRRAAHLAHLTRRFQAAGQPVFRVDYAELGDLDVVNGVARFAGSADALPDLRAPIIRQNPPALEDKVENVEELRAHLAVAPAAAAPVPADRAAAARYRPFRRLAGLWSAPLVYVETPGAGEAAIRALLTDVDEARAPPDPEAAEPRRLRVMRDNPGRLARLRRGGVVFTFVRHPVARLHAVFADLALTDPPGAEGEEPDPVRAALREALAERGADLADPGPEARAAALRAFAAFVADNLAERTRVPVRPEWTPQTALLAAQTEALTVDFVGRVERFAEDADFAFARAGIDIEETRLDAVDAAFRAEHEALRASGLVDAETEAAIRSTQAEDYARLGYDAFAPALTSGSSPPRRRRRRRRSA